MLYCATVLKQRFVVCLRKKSFQIQNWRESSNIVALLHLASAASHSTVNFSIKEISNVGGMNEWRPPDQAVQYRQAGSIIFSRALVDYYFLVSNTGF